LKKASYRRMVIVAKGRRAGLKGRFKDPFERDRLEPFSPSQALAAHFSNLAAENRTKKALGPDAGSHNLPHFSMMSRVVLDACKHLGPSSQGAWSTVILGARECADVPLEKLARQGFVYLVDVDMESLRMAKRALGDARLRRRVDAVSMDVSLFETPLLDRTRRLMRQHPADIGRAYQTVRTLHRDAAEEGSSRLWCRRLPIKDESVDLVVSSMTLGQLMTGYLQLLVKMFLEVYGREETQRYLLPGSQAVAGPEGSERIADLLRSTTSLGRKAAEKHLGELGRIARTGGVIVLSDHAFHGRCAFVTEDRVEVDVRTLVPYSKNPAEQKNLRFREDPTRSMPAWLTVDRTTTDPWFVVEGTDALKTLVENDERLQIVSQQGWWWVTERAKGWAGSRPAWHVSYVEAFTLRARSRRSTNDLP
jgi:SAM-dependent methyltransferase